MQCWSLATASTVTLAKRLVCSSYASALNLLAVPLDAVSLCKNTPTVPKRAIDKSEEKMNVEPAIPLQGSIVTTKPETTRKASGRLQRQINLTLVINAKQPSYSSPVQRTSNRLANLSSSLIDTKKSKKDIEIIDEVNKSINS